jgi:hypothetical protein
MVLETLTSHRVHKWAYPRRVANSIDIISSIDRWESVSLAAIDKQARQEAIVCTLTVMYIFIAFASSNVVVTTSLHRWSWHVTSKPTTIHTLINELSHLNDYRCNFFFVFLKKTIFVTYTYLKIYREWNMCYDATRGRSTPTDGFPMMLRYD